MFAAFLVLLVPALASGQFSYDIPDQCAQKCVENYQGGLQSACIRGCAISYVTKTHSGSNFPTCKDACVKDFENSNDYSEVCKKSCDMIPEFNQTLAQDNKPISVLQWIRSLFTNAYNKFKNCVRYLKGSKQETFVKTDKPVEQDKKEELDHPFFITRIRVFQRIIPDDSVNQDMVPMMPIHHMMIPNNVKESKDQSGDELEPEQPHHGVRLMWSVQNAKSEQPAFHYMLKHIIVSPIILSLFVVSLLLVSLITIKLVVQACHYRDARRIQYSRLPTYVEAVSVKIPYSDEDDVLEKKKPEDA